MFKTANKEQQVDKVPTQKLDFSIDILPSWLQVSKNDPCLLSKVQKIGVHAKFGSQHSLTIQLLSRLNSHFTAFPTFLSKSCMVQSASDTRHLSEVGPIDSKNLTIQDPCGVSYQISSLA